MDIQLLTTIATPTNVLWSLSIMIGGYVAKSLNSLNIKMAVVVEKIASHDDLIKEHSSDIKALLMQTRGRTTDDE